MKTDMKRAHSRHERTASAALKNGKNHTMTMRPKLRILYIIDSLVAGGVESQLVELISRLDHERFEAHVLVFYGLPDRPPHFLPHLRGTGAQVTVLNLSQSAASKLEAVRRIIAHTWRLRPHIIQAENYHANLLTRAARPALPPDVRVIGAHRAAHTAHQLRFERLEYRMCDVIVASAQHLKRQLITGAGVEPGRVVVIPNSIDVQRFGSAVSKGADVRARVAPGKRRLLVSMGRISHEKRMDLLAEALGQLKREGVTLTDVRVAIIGPSEKDAAQRALDAAITREGLDDIVVRIPSVSEPESYFAACDASVLASPIEGLPVVALESLAAGKPVILSAGANLAGVIEDGQTGWVAPTNSPADLAAALQRMLATHDSALIRMGERCRIRAEEYTIETLAQRYMTLYEALARFPRHSHRTERWSALAEATR